MSKKSSRVSAYLSHHLLCEGYREFSVAHELFWRCLPLEMNFIPRKQASNLGYTIALMAGSSNTHTTPTIR